MICAERDCTGAVQGGYCTVCGMAPSPGPSTNGSSAPASSRGHLGGGIVEVPRVPHGNPAAAILTDPQVPERHRRCSNHECNRPVGRTRNGEHGRTRGFCTRCGTPYCFTPRLNRGDVVGGQYEVQGCIAHGGLGWIYLAIDRNLDNRWVVLKGLVHAADAEAMNAAAAEARALVKMQHPNIVSVHNFVPHVAADGVAVGYIVMEFIDGTSLKQIRDANDGPLVPERAVAYIIEIASAITYLHEKGYAYCDFKPANVMQTEEQLKLIDLGAAVAMDDYNSAIFGTPGYVAPEIERTGPTVATDVYTVGRALAVLVMDVPTDNGRLVEQLPGPESEPVLAQHESLHRAIVRAVHPDPLQRFPSMADMADQLTGVLHEIVAATGASVPSKKSNHFSPQRGVFGSGPDLHIDPAEVIAALSVPVVDPNDPGASVLATTSGTPPDQLESALELARAGAHQGATQSVEIPLRLVRAALETGAVRDARKRLAALSTRLSGDWRLHWYRGQCALLEGDFAQADNDFDHVLAMLPGELAPKVALAATAEFRENRDRAERLYATVWRTDDSYISAGFGLARQCVRNRNRAGAIAALDRMPTASAYSAPAGANAIETLLDGVEPHALDETTLIDAGNRASALTLESAAKRAATHLRVFDAALHWLRAGNTPENPRLLGVTFDERGLRTAMEECYRALAHDETDMWERITLVERANKIRPRTRT